jgi:DNA-directed RNA polymerase subunit F
MIGNSNTSSRPASLSEVQKILEERQKVGDFGFEQQTSLEYAKKFAKEGSEDLAAELEKSGKLKRETAVKIADIRPKSISTLAAILSKDKIDATDAEMKGIMEKMKKA